MNTGATPMYGWNRMPWKKMQRNVFKLQKRIYQASQVRMTHATLLRSRMNGNVHVRFCSRVEVATPRLRQRPEGEGREMVQRDPTNAQADHGERSVELAKWK